MWKRDMAKDGAPLRHFQPNEFDLILADPPYEVRDFEKYGVKPFNKARIVAECSLITRRRGFLVWLDTILPPFSRRNWELYGIIGLVQSTNHRTRAISIFQKGEQ
jgi:16S rRNA G966 N2-methylase RsmD